MESQNPSDSLKSTTTEKEIKILDCLFSLAKLIEKNNKSPREWSSLVNQRSLSLYDCCLQFFYQYQTLTIVISSKKHNLNVFMFSVGSWDDRDFQEEDIINVKRFLKITNEPPDSIIQKLTMMSVNEI